MMSLFSRLGKWRQSRFNQMVGIKLKARSNLSASFLSTSSGTPTDPSLLERAATTLKSKNILQEMIRKYGKLAFVTYGFISILSCTFWYFAFQYGLEPRLPTDVNIPKWFLESKYAEYAPLIALIWSAHTVVLPIRLGATAVLTRILANLKLFK